MPADNGTFVAGHYDAKWGGSGGDALGTTESGFSIKPAFYKEEIKIDDYGDSTVDGIYRGYNIRVSTQLCEWTAAGRAKLQFPFDTTLGTITRVGMSLVGGGAANSGWGAQELYLNPINDISAASKIYRFPLSVPDGDHGGWTLNTRLRKVDVNLLVMPERSGANAGRLFIEEADA